MLRFSLQWYEMFLWLVLGVSLVALPCSWGKVYKKCELAQELLQVHGFAEDEVAECEYLTGWA